VSSDTPLPQIIDEARRLMTAAAQRDVPVRLIGGVAVRVRVDESFHVGLLREYRDIDFVTLKGRSKPVGRFLEDMGYEPNQQFNAMNGSERLLFYDMQNQRQLDVFVGAFRMCHAIPITERMTLDAMTVPLAELLLMKLQVVQLNEKDLRDIIAILHHHDVADHDGATINAAYVARLCAEDWGLWRTCTMNVARVREGTGNYDIAQQDRETVEGRLNRLWEYVEAQPKSRAWRLRDRIGDRKRWYDEPEEV
jgi:hypothetical protein